MTRYCLALDLKDDPQLIAEYEYWHRDGNGWPEIKKSILDAGITDMQIYRTGNRLTMIMEVNAYFDPVKKAEIDAENIKVQEWESLMSKFQQSIPWATEGEKWVTMNKIFQL
jgi:L-rhamnose mutarotase